MKPTVRDIINIRKKHNCDLFHALVKWAQELPDYTKYDGPYRKEVIDTVEYYKQEDEKARHHIDQVQRLKAQGYEPYDIVRMMRESVDIGSKSGWPASQLSNFAYSVFEIDGVRCNSAEGFLQALKFKDPKVQEDICKLYGARAKFAGKRVKWWKRLPKEQLWWKGQSFEAHSQQHLELVHRALKAKFLQDEKSEKALKETGNAALTHSIGKEHNTSLRASDFCRILTKIREEIKGVLEEAKTYELSKLKTGGTVKVLDKKGRYVADVVLQDHLNSLNVFEEIENFLIMKGWVK